MEFVLPIVFALFLWWFSTGAILYLDGLPRTTFPLSLAAITVMAIAGLVGASYSAGLDTRWGAYLGFLSGLAVWAWNETTFLLGYVTGPRREHCTAPSMGWDRISQATATILHHEVGIMIGAALLFALTSDGVNQTALWTFLVLWAMRLSSKLNLFLGVRNLSTEFLPDHLDYIGSYLARRPMNLLFPFSVTIATVVTAWLAHKVVAAPAGSGEAVSAALLTTLMALAVLEHWFLVLPIPFARLWSWGFASRAGTGNAGNGPADDSGSMSAARRNDWSAHLPRCLAPGPLQLVLNGVALGQFGAVREIEGQAQTNSGTWLRFGVRAGGQPVLAILPEATRVGMRTRQLWVRSGAADEDHVALLDAFLECEFARSTDHDAKSEIGPGLGLSAAG